MKPKIVIIGLSGESVFLKTDHFHRDGETISAYEKYTEPGGKGYNQAVAAACFNADVTFLTTVGSDYYGKYAVEYIKNKGVNVKCRFVDQKQTAYAVILRDKNGNNEVSVYSGASNDLTCEDVLLIEEDIKNASYVLIQLELSDEIIAKIFEITEKYNVKVVLNPAPSRIIGEHKFYKKAEILTPNEIEVKDIYDIPDNLDYLEFGEYLMGKVNKTLIVTLGAKGCLLVEKDYYKYFEPIKVKAIDTTGAGDIFNAGLVTKLAEGLDIEEAIKFAIIVSAMSVEKPYVMDAIPTLEEVNKKSGI